jgi:hypothetical protein
MRALYEGWAGVAGQCGSLLCSCTARVVFGRACSLDSRVLLVTREATDRLRDGSIPLPACVLPWSYPNIERFRY